MAYTKYSLTPANNTATPPDGAPEGMLPSAVNDTMRDMMAQIRDVGDGIRNGTYTMTAPVITGGSITGVALSGNTFTNPVITGGSINNTPIGASTANTGAFTTLSASGVATISAGTVSAPALTTTGDTNTGIFFPAADTIAFTEGGVESMRIDSSGNVGIGITPSAWPVGFKALQIVSSSIYNNSANDTFIGANYFFDGTNNKYINTDLAAAYGLLDGQHIWYTAPSGTAGNNVSFAERMRIDSSGNVGIGTSSPSAKLNVVGGTTAALVVAGGASSTIRNTASSGSSWFVGTNVDSYILHNESNTPMLFTTNGTERMRITSGGEVGINTSSPTASVPLTILANSSNAIAQAIRGRSDGIGVLLFTDNAGTENGRLDFRTDVAILNQTRNAPLVFNTNATERMRITSGGDVLVAASISENGNTRLSVRQSGAGNNCIWAHNTSTSDGASKFVATTAVTTASGTHFFYDAGYNWSTSFARAFAVRGDGVIFALNTTIQSLSDQRLKENIVDSTDGLSVITSLRPVRFDWKKETGILKTNQLGFIAQEVEQVFPDAVDTYDNSNDPQDPYKSVGSGALIPVLVKAIQEQQAMIEELKQEVAALKASH